MKYLDFAKSVLKTNSYRLTKARLLVLQVLTDSRKALNAYEIASKVEKLGEKVDVSTVYRILEVYKELNLVHFNANKQRYTACQDFECANDDHCHHEFVCDECDEVVELHIDDKSWIKTVQNLNETLSINSHRLEFFGLCSNCK